MSSAPTIEYDLRKMLTNSAPSYSSIYGADLDTVATSSRRAKGRSGDVLLRRIQD